MACEGFTGIMSCACKMQCWERLGHHGVKIKPCFELADTTATAQPQLSDYPDEANRSVSVRLRLRPHGRVYVGAAAERLLARSDPSLAGLRPQANRRCPLSCSHSGSCFRDGAGTARCHCHAGFVGLGCERLDSSACLNGCSGRGACRARWCRCLPGWFGPDCSLSLHASGGSASVASPALAEDAPAWNVGALPRPAAPPRRRYVPVGLYSLPHELSTMHHLYQNDPTTRGVFYANRVFLQQLLSRQDAGFTCSPHPASGPRPYYAALDHLQARCPRGACVAWEPLRWPPLRASSRSKACTTCHCQVKTRSSPRSRRPSSSWSQ